MANNRISSRGTALDRVITSPGFRRGFEDQRNGLGFPSESELARRNTEWWWWLEDGRLFAASTYSGRFKKMPTARSNVTPTLIKAFVAAMKGGVFPEHRRDR